MRQRGDVREASGGSRGLGTAVAMVVLLVGSLPGSAQTDPGTILENLHVTRVQAVRLGRYRGAFYATVELCVSNGLRSGVAVRDGRLVVRLGHGKLDTFGPGRLWAEEIPAGSNGVLRVTARLGKADARRYDRLVTLIERLQEEATTMVVELQGTLDLGLTSRRGVVYQSSVEIGLRDEAWVDPTRVVRFAWQ